MTKNKTYLRLHCLLYAVLVAMAAVGVCGCSDDDGEAPAVIAKDVVVSFRVVTESQPQTRAVTPTPSDITWGDLYDNEAGDAFDNTLLMEGFSVFVTNADCTERYAEVTRLICTKTIQDDNTIVYNFVGEIAAADAQKLISAGTGKFHVVANMPGFTLPQTGIDHDQSFTLYGQPSDNFKAIPMWGVATINNFADMAKMVNPNDLFDAGEVWLLRSMAKVEIEIDSETDNNLITELVNATVTGANGEGYLLPTIPPDWAGISETKNIKIDNTLNKYNSETKASGTYTPNDNKKIIFYLPESQNTDGENDIKINLNFKLGDTLDSGIIHFAKYDNGSISTDKEYYNIVRNHLYRFSVRRKAQDTELTIIWTVCPMKTLQSNIPDFE